MSGRFLQITGLAAAGGIGYYLYNAGGDPKAAQKRAEADAAKLSSNVKQQLPGTTKEAQKDAEVLSADARAKLEHYRKDAQKGLDNAKETIAERAEAARRESQKAVDAFDNKVEASAAKAKSGISSWFGGSK